MLPFDPPIVSIYFDFYGTFDPAEITERLDLEPTRQFRAGEQGSTGARSHRRDGWVIQIGPEKTFEIDGLLKEAEAAVTASPEAILRVSRELDLEVVVTCEVRATAAMPSVRFSSHFVKWAASFGAVIDVDIMLLEKE